MTACRSGRYVLISREEAISNSFASLGLMAAKYGYDISGPATNAQEAIQWTYFGYLAAVMFNSSIRVGAAAATVLRVR